MNKVAQSEDTRQLGQVAPREQLEHVLHEAWSRPFYRRHWLQAEGIREFDDIMRLVHNDRFHQLPVVRKANLRDNLDDLVVLDGASDIFSSSGTTGRPLDIPILPAEEASQVARIRRLLRELGVKPGSRVLQLLSMNDLFALGPLAWQAVKAEGGCVIRCTPQRIGRVRQVIEHLKPEFVIGNPFALVRIAEEASDWWPDPSALPNHAFFAVAATFDSALQPTPVVQRVAELWGFQTWLNTYGSSEVGPVGYECQHHQGLHIHDDAQFVELIDPETQMPVTDPEQPGEVVVTGLTLPRGFITIRYATGDIVGWLRRQPCSCGRTSPRIGPVVGRINHQLKVVGQTMFPDLLLSLADQCPGVKRSAVYVRDGALDGDDVTVLVLPNERDNAAQIQQSVHAELSRHLAVAPAVQLTCEADLAALEARASVNTNMVKIPRFFDFRKSVTV